ncbi:DUF6233 domain-containing protein [Streptomyces sp. NPDC059445]|uniref:DUF6233 domain-containing protein n=1 Tax=Streptomyces sp. NPDC059445 TaxID=3346832 RepID=UPI0036B0F6EA
MNDPAATSRLDLLYFLERVQRADLDRARRWIADEEQRQEEKERGRQARPPAPEWMIEQGLNGGMPVYVHVGDCHMAGKRSIGVDRDQARRALVEGVTPCTHCRPDSELGIVEA